MLLALAHPCSCVYSTHARTHTYTHTQKGRSMRSEKRRQQISILSSPENNMSHSRISQLTGLSIVGNFFFLKTHLSNNITGEKQGGKTIEGTSEKRSSTEAFTRWLRTLLNIQKLPSAFSRNVQCDEAEVSRRSFGLSSRKTGQREDV